jgi:hypothetical protein
MLSKNFIRIYIVTVLILGFLSQFSFKAYLLLTGIDRPDNQEAVNDAFNAWLQGMNYFNILLLASMVIVGFMYMFKRNESVAKKA